MGFYMFKLYNALIKVDGHNVTNFNSIVQRLEAAGLRGVNCFFDTDCIHCRGYLPLDRLQEVKYITGVMDVILTTSDDESD